MIHIGGKQVNREGLNHLGFPERETTRYYGINDEGLAQFTDGTQAIHTHTSEGYLDDTELISFEMEYTG
ncbi:hypothetical protein BVX93_00005, partial [bacterium B13(2017)]